MLFRSGLISSLYTTTCPAITCLDRKTVYYLQQFATINLQKLNSIRINPATKRCLQQVLDTLYDNEVGLNLKAKRFIRQMNKWEQNIGKLSMND